MTDWCGIGAVYGNQLLGNGFITTDYLIKFVRRLNRETVVSREFNMDTVYAERHFSDGSFCTSATIVVGEWSQLVDSILCVL